MTQVDSVYSQDRQAMRFDLALCPHCGNSLDFPTDGMGQVLEGRCLRCRDRSRILASVRPASSATVKLATEIVRQVASAPAPEPANPPLTAAPPPMVKRTYSPKRCPCGITFSPTGPRQKYHAENCPARTGQLERKIEPEQPSAAQPPSEPVAIEIAPATPANDDVDTIALIDTAMVALRLARQRLAAVQGR